MHFIVNLLFVTSITQTSRFQQGTIPSKWTCHFHFFFFFRCTVYKLPVYLSMHKNSVSPFIFVNNIPNQSFLNQFFFYFASLLINLASFKYVCTIVVECMRHCYKKWGNVIRIYKLFTNFDSVEVFCLPVVIFLNHRL